MIHPSEKSPSLSSCQAPHCFLVSAPRVRQTANFPMSKHNSLKLKGGAEGKRSVMKRFERIKVLKSRGQWQEGRSPIGLPKTKGEG